MAELSGRQAKVRITSISPTSSTGEAGTLTQSTGTEFVQINDTSKRHFDRNVSTGFALYLNSTAVSSTAYDINWVQGKFEFRSTGQSTGTYTMDVEHLTTTYLGKAREWSITNDVDMLDVTTFSTSTADVQWRTFIPGLSEWTGAVEKLISTGDTGPAFFDRQNLPNDVIVEFVMEDFTRFEGYARVQGIDFDSPIDDVIVESIDLRGDGQLYLSTT